VLDASIALTWCFEDEASPETDKILDSLENTHAEVPALFPFELQNILRTGARRGRVTEEGIIKFWKRLLTLDIRIEPYLSFTPLPSLADLAKEHGLTAYDASYLDLANRRSLPLASLDRQLQQAAKSAGVKLLL
jgi:predicted nucleic acid-binding protein